METITVRKYTRDDVAAMVRIWNEVVEERRGISPGGASG